MGTFWRVGALGNETPAFSDSGSIDEMFVMMTEFMFVMMTEFSGA